MEAGQGAATTSRSSSGRNAVHRGGSAAHRHGAALAGASGIGGEDLVAARLHPAGHRGSNARICIGASSPRGSCWARSARCFPRADAKAPSKKCASWKWRNTRGSRRCWARPVPARRNRDGRRKITIDDFLKVDLRVGMVKDAAAVKGSDKLLHLQVDIGEPKPRSIVAGIARRLQARSADRAQSGDRRESCSRAN